MQNVILTTKTFNTMKALKVLSIVAMAAALAACGKKELVLDYTNLKMNCGDTQTVAVMSSTNPCTWEIGDVNVATIKQDNGLKNDITAVHVGETVVTVTDSKGAKGTLSVVVESKYNLFKQPDLTFIGKAKADVVAALGEPVFEGDDENGASIGYQVENVYVFYLLDNDVVDAIQVALPVSSQTQLNNFYNFIQEYYYLYGSTQSGAYVFGNAPEMDNATILITAAYTQGYAFATYFKNEPAASGAPRKLVAPNLF